MAQAKILTKEELARVLAHIASRPHSARNRCLTLLSHLTGMRVAEISSTRLCDVLNMDGTIKEEIRLKAEQTKGKHPRTVYVNERMRKELALYIRTLNITDTTKPLFYSQKKEGFSPNSLAQYFFYLYKAVGIMGASSHSGRRTFLTGLANKCTAIHILKTLAGHRSISTTAAYLYSSPSQLKAAAELAGM